MVRGRRVREIYACAREDDCCSPIRKDQRLDPHGKLSEIVSSYKTQTITQFFQTVEEESVVEVCKITEKSNLSGNAILSPATPHRIELCTENSPPKTNLPQLKKRAAPPRARRKLNANHYEQQSIDNVTSHKLTEYFPVRRSVRKTKKTVLEEKQRTLEHILRKDIEEGLKVQNFEGKGRGIVADKPFSKSDFVVEYSGELIDMVEAKQREKDYAQDQNTGCYMYYFKHKNLQYCIDATSESGRLGRLVNHSRNGNLMTRTVSVDNRPRLVLIAKDHIKAGEEVTYDYGDRSKESLKYHPWLAF